ncbi:DUF1206 domain-containing protein [soil metagenome]
MDTTLSLSKNKNIIIKLARFGYITKGIVYCLVGILASLAAIGSGSTRNTDRNGVINFVMDQPFGQILLGIISIGLLGYVMWRIIETIKDPHDHGNGAKGLITRAGYAISAIVYSGLSIYVFRLLLTGERSNGNGETQRTIVQKVLELPLGEWIVGIIAVIIFIRGFQQIFKALSGKYRKDLREERIHPDFRKVVVRSGAVGSIARGAVWGVIAFFFFNAAMNGNSNEIGGTGNALGFLASDFGPWVLGFIALGLTCYGIFKILQGLYLRLDLE